MFAETTAGVNARTAIEAPQPQESSATPCDSCETRAADGIAPDGRSLCTACARRERTLVCDGGNDLEETRAELKEAIADIPDVDPASLTLSEGGDGQFTISSNEQEQNVDEIDAALDGTGYERDGIFNPPRETHQCITRIEEE